MKDQKKILRSLVVLALILVAYFLRPQEAPRKNDFSLEAVAHYVSVHQELPDGYITKNEARALGWEERKGNLSEVAPGKAIGGDRFQNREKLLPDAPDRIWYEADLDYDGGYRGPKRLLYSSDGLIYYTLDHYETMIRWEESE